MNLKKWVLSWKFVKEAVDGNLQETLGAIKRYEQYKLQEVEELANKKLNALLSTVDNDQIVKLDKVGKRIYIGSKLADEVTLSNLKSEAQFLLSSEIWKLMQETPKELAQRAMFIDSENLDGLKKGRSILFTLSTQKNIVDIFNNYQPNPMRDKVG